MEYPSLISHLFISEDMFRTCHVAGQVGLSNSILREEYFLFTIDLLQIPVILTVPNIIFPGKVFFLNIMKVLMKQ